MAGHDRGKEYEKSRTAWYLSKLFILIIIIVLGWYAYRYYLGEFDQVYEHAGPSYCGGFITGLPPDTPCELNINVAFHTTTLSAQNPITVEVWLRPSEDYHLYQPNPWFTYPEKEWLVFPRALDYPIKSFGDGDYESAAILVKRDDVKKEFYGTGQMIYPFEGRYGFLFIGQSEMDKNTKGDGLSYMYADTLESRIYSEAYFLVGSNDAVTELKTNNLIVALTLAFIGFGIAELHGIITTGLFLIGEGILRIVLEIAVRIWWLIPRIRTMMLQVKSRLRWSRNVARGYHEIPKGHNDRD